MTGRNSQVDVVIPYHRKDGDIIDLSLRSCLRYIPSLRKIFVVTEDTNRAFDGAEVIPECELFDGLLSKEYIAERWVQRCPQQAHRAGWLFQQFIKMGCAYAIDGIADHYVVVDSDVVFLKPLELFRDDRIVLVQGTKIHRPYFDVCEKLLGGPVEVGISFISHHMIIDRRWMLELLDMIECRSGRSWYDAILDSIDFQQGSAFSEYETYGCYLSKYHPDGFVIRPQCWSQDLGLKGLLSVLFNRVDYFAFHNHKRPSHPVMYRLIRSIVASKLR